MNLSQEGKQQLGYYAIAVVAALVVFGAGYMFLVKPPSQRASFLATRLASDQARQEAENAAYNSASQLSKVELADLFDLTRAMPDDAQVSEILVVLGRLAEHSNVEFNSIKPAPVVPLAGYQALPMELTIQGNFYDLMEFLYEMRHLVDVRPDADGTAKLFATGRLFAINKINVAIATTGDLNKPLLTATVNLDAFIYGSGTPVAAAPASSSTTTTEGSASAAGAPTGGNQ